MKAALLQLLCARLRDAHGIRVQHAFRSRVGTRIPSPSPAPSGDYRSSRCSISSNTLDGALEVSRRARLGCVRDRWGLRQRAASRQKGQREPRDHRKDLADAGSPIGNMRPSTRRVRVGGRRRWIHRTHSHVVRDAVIVRRVLRRRSFKVMTGASASCGRQCAEHSGQSEVSSGHGVRQAETVPRV